MVNTQTPLLVIWPIISPIISPCSWMASIESVWVTDWSVMNLSQQQCEVPNSLGTTPWWLIQWQLKEGEGEAAGEAQVGDWTQWREAGGARHASLWQHLSPRPQSPPPYTCWHKQGELWLVIQINWSMLAAKSLCDLINHILDILTLTPDVYK